MKNTTGGGCVLFGEDPEGDKRFWDAILKEAVRKTFEEVYGMNTEKTTIESQKGTKYSFVGRPDFNRIIRENEGADVIIVSREDGLLNFIFRVGLFPNGTTATNNNTLTWLMRDSSCYFSYPNKDVDIEACDEMRLPAGWVRYTTRDAAQIKELRRLAQRFVALRTGKHTVEALP